MTERDDALAHWAAARLGVDTVELRELLGGAGNRGFEVYDRSDADRPLAFLRTKSDAEYGARPGFSLQREGAILDVARGLGFPVAPVLGTLGEPDSLLMGYVPGVSRPSPAEIAVVGPKYMALIAAVHASDARLFPVEHHATMGDAVAADIASWTVEAADRHVIDEPTIALGARVLTDRLPTGTGPAALVHGDVGAGNFLALDGEVSAMLDWELAHTGDPHEDLAWLWMRGAHTDFGDPWARFAEYEAAAGVSVDHDRLAWNVAAVMWKSVISLHARLRSAVPGELAMVQLIVMLTYDALLGAQLVCVLGGSTAPSAPSPERSSGADVNLAEELLGVADLAADQRVVLEYLRDSMAQAPWERRALERDCSTLGIEPADLLGHIRACPSDDLPAVATVVARAAERRALASPKSVRRIERARRIGLGTS